MTSAASLSEQTAFAHIRMLINAQQIGVLSTVAKNRPHASIVGFAGDEDLRNLYFVTPRNSRKFVYIQQCPQVAFLIDNRQHQADDFYAAKAVTVTGNVLDTQTEAREEAIQIYTRKHPQLTDFATDLSSAVCQLQVQTYRLVTDFQTVTEITFE